MTTNKILQKQEEVANLAKWLVSIPSISTSKGESVIINAIYNGICDFSYFKNKKEQLFLISHEDQVNSSIIALVLCNKDVADTNILLCNADTSTLDNYGNLKKYAFKSDELAAKLASLNIDHDLKDEISKEDNLMGLGVLESKAACASFLVMLKDYSDNINKLNSNLIFVCTSSSIDKNKGIKACLPYLTEIANKYNLKYKLAINARPSLSTDNDCHIYTKSLGHMCPSFYIMGRNDIVSNPYKNFSSSLIASKLIESLELNPNITEDLSHFCSFLKLDDFYTNKNKNHMTDILLRFKLNFFNMDPSELIKELKQYCVMAMQDVSSILDGRERSYSAYKKEICNLDTLDAEVLTYKELFKRAARRYQGNLSSAIETLIVKAKEDGIADTKIYCSILDRLSELARILRPAIIIFLTDDYNPQQNYFSQMSKDRENLMTISKLVTRCNEQYDFNMIMDEEPYSSQEMSFMRPTAANAAINALMDQCPVAIDNFYNLDVSTLTIGINGKDINLPTERVNKKIFTQLLNFIESILCHDLNFKAEEHGKEEDDNSTVDDLELPTMASEMSQNKNLSLSREQDAAIKESIKDEEQVARESSPYEHNIAAMPKLQEAQETVVESPVKNTASFEKVEPVATETEESATSSDKSTDTTTETTPSSSIISSISKDKKTITSTFTPSTRSSSTRSTKSSTTTKDKDNKTRSSKTTKSKRDDKDSKSSAKDKDFFRDHLAYRRESNYRPGEKSSIGLSSGIIVTINNNNNKQKNNDEDNK